MSLKQKQLEKITGEAIAGAGAHVSPDDLLDGLEWRSAGLRPDGVPFSVFQLLHHIIYWQDWGVSWLDGEDPPIPSHASGSWPDAVRPETEEAWEKTIERFLSGQEQLRKRCTGGDLLSTEGEKSRLEMLLTIALHNSYHAGQVVFLRRVLGSWPPPSGGVTW